MDIENEISRIQRSTRTLFRSFIPIHDWLRLHSRLYYIWSLKPYARTVHWTLLFLYIALLPAIFGSAFIVQNVTQVKATTYDFPRWEWTNPKPTGVNLNDVSTCPDNTNIGYAVGDYGTIIKTENGGESWQEHYSGTENKLTDVLCVSKTNIIAIGENKTVLQNFGNNSTWTERIVESTVTKIVNIGHNIIILGGSTIISIDGGLSWQKVIFDNTPEVSFINVASYNSSRAIAIRISAVYESVDSGLTWTLVNSNSGLNAYSGSMVAFNDGLHAVYAVEEDGLVKKTSDGGRNWSTVFTGSACSALSSFGENGVVFSGVDGLWDNEDVLVTNDMGETWQTYNTDRPLSYIRAKNSQTFVSISNTFYCDDTCVDYVSYNGGSIWQETDDWASIYYADSDIIRLPTSENTGLDDLDLNTQYTSQTLYLHKMSPDIVYSSNGTTAFAIQGGNIIFTDSASQSQNWQVILSSDESFGGVLALEDETKAIAYGSAIYLLQKTNDEWSATLKEDNTSIVKLSALGNVIAGGGWFSDDGGIVWSQPAGITCAKSYPIEETAEVARFLCDNNSKTLNTIIEYNKTIQTWSQDTFSTPSEEEIFDMFTVFPSKKVLAGSLFDDAIYYCADIINDSSNWTNTNFPATNSYITDMVAFPGSEKAAVTLRANVENPIYLVDMTKDITEFYTQVDISESTSNLALMIWTLNETEAVMITANGPDLSNASGELLYTSDSGLTWEKWPRKTNSQIYSLAFHYDTESATRNILALVNGGKVLWYHSPPIESDRLMIGFDAFGSYSGQKFVRPEGLDPESYPITVKAGQLVSTTIYAVEDIENGYNNPPDTPQVRFTTTDPKDTNPEVLQLVNGQGTTNFQFHTVGTWTITAYDVNNFLLPATSSQITVLPGDPAKVAIASTNSQTSVRAGVSMPMTVTVLDQFGNQTSALPDTPLTVKLTSSDSGRFSTSENGPWTESLDLIIPPGSGTATYYYLNFTTGSQTVTASLDGLTDSSSTFSVTINPGDIETTILGGTRVEVDPTTQAVGGSVTVKVYLAGTGRANRTITLHSSKSSDTFAQPAPTDGSGATAGALVSTVSGDSTVHAKVADPEGDIWLESSPSANFLPGPVKSISLSANLSKNTDNKLTTPAGKPFNVVASLFDQYRNLATNTTDTVALASTDISYYIPFTHKMTTTDAGRYTFANLSLKTAGEQTITVTDTDTDIKSILPVVVTALLPSSSASTFTTDKNKLIIDQDTAMLTVKISDEHGNGIAGEEVEVRYQSESGSVGKPKKITDSNGEAKFIYTPLKEGRDILSARNITSSFTLNQTIKIENLPDTLLNQLQNNPTAKKIADVAKAVAAVTGLLGLIPLLANIIGGAPGAVHVLNYGFSLFFEAIGIRKRRKSWGRVYDSTTGRGIDLALVRLYDQQTAKLAGTIVTDIQGRYNFRLEPGTYAISVSKQGYLFPTQIFAKYGIQKIDKADSRSNTHYVGQPVTIGESNNFLNIDIPIDPVEKTPSLFVRVKIITSDLYNLLSGTLSSAFLTLLVIGTILSIFTAVVLPETRNTLLACLYTIVTGSYILSRHIRSTHFGVVFNMENGKALPEAVVSLFDSQYGTLKETRITDRYGRFSIYAQKGNYYIKVQKDDYNMDDGKIHGHKALYFGRQAYRGQTIKLKKPGYVVESVGMNKLDKNSSQE